MPFGSLGACCGDDPQNTPPTPNDAGRVWDTGLQDPGDWLCTRQGSAWKANKSVNARNLLIYEARLTSDFLSSGRNWYLCDSNKNSDGNGNFDQQYNYQEGFRVDNTCRYPSGGGFFCGAISPTDLVEKLASLGGPMSLLSQQNLNDNLWYNFSGTLLAFGGESIGTSSSPFSVTLNGLASANTYVVSLQLATDAQGNEFHARLGTSGAFTRLGEKYPVWTDVPVGSVSGVSQVTIQFYFNRGNTSGISINLARAVKLGVPVGQQKPVVRMQHDYFCGTNLTHASLPGGRLAGERFVECCGDLGCYTGQGLRTGDEITTGGKTWRCHSDFRFYDLSQAQVDPTVCELLGYAWSGGECCGDNPGEVLQWSWRGEELGCCKGPSSQQCLVSNAGSVLNNDKPDTFYTTQGGPVCIASGQYVLDRLCESSVWKSRNKPLADRLLRMLRDANANSYALFCDNYTNALAYFNYLTSGNNPIEQKFLADASCAAGARNYPCLNTFCVASAPGLVAVGGSFNPPISVGQVEEVFSLAGACSSAQQMDGEFHRCGNAQKLWLNNASRSFIYSAQGANVPGSGLFSWVQGAFDSFLAWISGQGGQYQLVDEVVQKADTYSVFYVNVEGGKTIFAREEGVYAPSGYDAVIAANFTGFTTDLCGIITSKFPGSCSQVGGSGKYVAAVQSDPQQASLFDLWSYLTGSLRVS